MRIAIFGGSFDPPHIGHEAIIKEAARSLDVDKIIVIPAFLNPFKSSALIDAPRRLELIQKLFDDELCIQVCDYEVNQNRAVNTVETVEYLQQHYSTSHIYLIVGADNYKTIHTWNSYDKLKNLVEFVVAKRHCVDETFDNVKLLDININISSTTLRETLKLEYIPKKIQNDVMEIWHQKEAQ